MYEKTLLHKICYRDIPQLKKMLEHMLEEVE
jgi:hypothetical protein